MIDEAFETLTVGGIAREEQKHLPINPAYALNW